MTGSFDARALVDRIADSRKATFQARRTILSFDEYLSEVGAFPRRHLRNAARYLADVVEHFGVDELKHSGGTLRRFRLFDQAFDDARGRVAGQERVQAALVRILENFVRAGRIDRLVLLHGPNGSAKTSIIQALTRASEVYSQTDEGAIYRFNWVFPTGSVQKGSLGFGGARSSHVGSYAHLDAAAIEARLPCELKDHPLFLLSRDERADLLNGLVAGGGLDADWIVPEVLKLGELSLKNRRIFDALLSTYHGDVKEVLRHVQIERFYLSRRYRQGIVAVEPQLSVDAYSRQITADRSIASLPTALHHVALYETAGALNDANRGVIEFNDLLKRPLDAWKYLLVATEQAQASLDHVSVFLDVVMLASSNEHHLDAFKGHPDWPSFKGRFELVTTPYLLRVKDELSIYESQLPRALAGVHIAPHALEVAATFAVLTRLEPPDASAYPEGVRDVVATLTPVEKMHFYNNGDVPERLSQRERKELRAVVEQMANERASGDHRAALDHAIVQHRGVHADEGVVLDGAGVQERHVADRDVLADDGRHAARGDVDHRAILDVAVLADTDARPVAAQHAGEPDAGVGGDVDIADQGGVGRNKRAGVDARHEIVERNDQPGHRPHAPTAPVFLVTHHDRRATAVKRRSHASS